jgi:hypothetical protein
VHNKFQIQLVQQSLDHELKEQNQLPQGTIRLLATAGEEKEQEGAKLLADKGYLDDVDGLMNSMSVMTKAIRPPFISVVPRPYNLPSFSVN